MNKTYLAKLAIVSFTVVAAFAFMGTRAQAETGSISSTVSIATPVTIVGDSALIFGVFTAPSTGTDNWTINASTGVLTYTGTGDGIDIFADDHHRGGFTINGEAGATVTYSVAITTNFGDANTTLSALTINPTSTSVLTAGSLVVGVGGTVTLLTTAASGTPAVITLTANY